MNEQNNIVIIDNFLKDDERLILEKIIEDLPFEQKNSQDYVCLSYLVEKKNSLFSIFEKIFTKEQHKNNICKNITTRALEFGNLFEIIILNEGSYLKEHTDGYNGVQCVYYLGDSLEKKEGGLLIAESQEIEYQKNRCISFLGHIPHEVTKVLKNKKRISITFGYKYA